MLIYVQIQNDSSIHFGKDKMFLSGQHHKFHVRLKVTEDNRVPKTLKLLHVFHF